MPKTKISEFDVDPANNTDINSINIAEGCAPSGINNAIRQLMSDLKEFQTGGGGDPFNGAVNGTVGATTANTGAFTTLSATGVTTVSAGSVSAPAITTTGDTNTGIFFPAADTIAFTEGGTEAMRINSSGAIGIGSSATNRLNLSYDGGSGQANIGPNSSGGSTFLTIGTSSSGTYSERMRIDSAGNVGIGTSSPSNKLSVYGANVEIGNGLNDGKLTVGSFVGTGSQTDIKSGGFTTFTTYSGGAFYERMRIDSSGNLGIGTSSPTARVHISSPDGTAPLTLNSAGGSDSTRALNFNIAGDNYGKILVPSASGGAMAFWTGGANAAAERMRIDSSGNVLVGATTNDPGAKVYSQTTGSWGFFARVGNGAGGIGVTNTSGTSSYNAMIFYNNGISFSTCGSISVSGTTTSYNTTSDYRLKENVVPMTGALAKISALKPVTYKWKFNGSDGQGFIAHELQAVVPDCVTGEKDALDKDGKPQYQGIDTSFLVATLTAAIQELKAEVDALKAQINQ
jgi:hypothetical protein